MIKIIAMLGDSHTWGEGVGAEYYFIPPCQGGELRMSPFGYPNYVNLLRDGVNIATNSSAKEFFDDSLKAICKRNNGQYGIIDDEAIVLNEKFGFCRLFFKADSVETDIDIAIDGNIESCKFFSESDATNKCIKVCNLFAEECIHELKISAHEGQQIEIFRIELYSGEYAVVNCGVGSCTVENYAKKYFDKYIRELAPYCVVFECNTINDWISGKSVDKYSADVEDMVEKIRLITDKIIIHTPFPISGGQYYVNQESCYDDYIDAVRNVAEKKNVVLVDTNLTMKKMLENIPEQSKNAFMYHDRWHPNGTGHYIYAREIFDEIKKSL